MSLVRMFLITLFALCAACWFISIAMHFLCLFRICVVRRALDPHPMSISVCVWFIGLLLMAFVYASFLEVSEFIRL